MFDNRSWHRGGCESNLFPAEEPPLGHSPARSSVESRSVASRCAFAYACSVHSSWGLCCSGIVLLTLSGCQVRGPAEPPASSRDGGDGVAMNASASTDAEVASQQHAEICDKMLVLVRKEARARGQESLDASQADELRIICLESHAQAAASDPPTDLALAQCVRDADELGALYRCAEDVPGAIKP